MRGLTMVMTLGMALFLVPVSFAAGSSERTNKDEFGVAIKGYDTVAYFAEGRPVKGVKAFSYSWRGAEWRFASAANRDLFVASPEKYAPQYGGH